ncbi:MAG: SusD/RagB family nutrient-binding outer membrane lipoprotein [Pedobacter sp.]|nr:SusD/RagB family nutrient-binding outer membrane lipoprotein [Pedobacter sp.]
MKTFKNIFTTSLIVTIILCSSSCKKFYDINADPDAILEAPLPTILTSATVNIGYFSGSDLNRYSSLIMQQFSGQSTGTLNQTQQYEKYEITGNDANNLFSTAYATILNDLETIITRGTAEGSPHYTGEAKILKAYMYQTLVDAFGDLPYSESQKLTLNLAPKYDDDEAIYTAIIALCDQGIAEVNAAVSKQSPGSNSTIYPGTFATTKTNWVKFANTLKLRLFLHYSEKNAAFTTSSMNTLINAGAQFLGSNADNFQMAFVNAASARNPFDSFETGRPGYLVANNTLLTMMDSQNDPRRAAYFTAFATAPFYRGAKGGDPGNAPLYSKLHTYLRGALVGAAYSGAAPVRMLTFAEYNFIRAEAALRFGITSGGTAQSFFAAGITASLTDAGVAAVDQSTYLAASGTLTGSNTEQLKQIIEQKYIASYGLIMEPWTDWRRTGFPAITPPVNALVTTVPRSLYYPQSEIDYNPNAKQKTSLSVRTFWDTRP